MKAVVCPACNGAKKTGMPGDTCFVCDGSGVKNVPNTIDDPTGNADVRKVMELVTIAKSDYDDMKEEIESLRQQLAKRENHLREAQHEIDILRRYGNKDCTAMADEELERSYKFLQQENEDEMQNTRDKT